MEHRAAVRLLAVPDRRLLSAGRPDPSFAITVPRLLSFLATGSFNGEVQGINQLQAQYEQQYGPGNYIPPRAADVLVRCG